MSRPLAASVLVAVLALAGAGATAAAAPPNYPDVEAQYMCVSCNIPLAEAESPQAQRERVHIHALIAQGLDEAQIKRDMVRIYGPAVLQLPPRSGFNLVAYVVPVLLVVALVAGLLFVLPRWRRRPPAAGPGGPDVLSTAEDARLDADLAAFDR